MTDSQMYFAIAIPVFAVIFSTAMNVIIIVWQARGIERRIDGLERRIDRIEHTLDVIQADLKQFYADIAKLKERSGL